MREPLQAQCGTIPLLKGKGAAARALADLLLRFRHAARRTWVEAPPWPACSALALRLALSALSAPPALSALSAPALPAGWRACSVASLRGRQQMRHRLLTAEGGGGGRKEKGAVAAAPAGRPQIDCLIVLDRSVDLVTPLCTQLTYEGLVDELLRIVSGAIELPSDADPTVLRKVRLNSSDALFKQLRDLDFGRACQRLREKSSELQQEYRAMKGARVEEQGVSEIKGFVRALRDNMQASRPPSPPPPLPARGGSPPCAERGARSARCAQGVGVDLHASISKILVEASRGREFTTRLELERELLDGASPDSVLEGVEAMVHRQGSLTTALRLLALASLTGGGIPGKRLDALRRDILHCYGHQHLLTLKSLQAAGLLERREASPRPWWPLARKGLKLVVDGLSDSAPDDIAYCYSHSGYAPLSVRLVQAALRGPWRAIEDVLRALPGPHFEVTQAVDEHGTATEAPADPGALDAAAARGGRPPVVLVLLMGGVTFAELSALRFTAAHPPEGAPPRTLIMASTKMLTGDRLIESLLAASPGTDGAS